MTGARRLSYLAPFFCLMYGVGFLGHAHGGTRPLMILLTPWVILLLGGIAVLDSVREGGPGLVVWGAGTFLVTFLLEVAGVLTGLVFGRYEYGDVLGPHVFGVPPVIGFNWVVVVLGFALLSEGLLGRLGTRAAGGRDRVRHVLAASFLTALFAAAFDFILEPAAIGLGYWTWEGGDVPLRNYAAWFLIAFFSAAAYFGTRQRVVNRAPAVYVLVQAVFFAALRFVV